MVPEKSLPEDRLQQLRAFAAVGAVVGLGAAADLGPERGCVEGLVVKGLREAVSTKSPKRHGIRDIHKYRGILKGDKPLTDKERDMMRFKYLTEKYA